MRQSFLLYQLITKTIDGTVQTHTAELKVHNEQIASKVTATQVAQQIADTEIGMTDKANNLISDIASDGKLTPSEKYELKREYDSIVKEYPNVLAQGTKYEVNTADYTAKYTNLINYVKNNRLFDDMGETVAVDGEELRKTFSDYYASIVSTLLANNKND